MENITIDLEHLKEVLTEEIGRIILSKNGAKKEVIDDNEILNIINKVKFKESNPPKNIFLIQRKDSIGFDEYDAHIVAATNPTEILEVIPIGDEGKDAWLKEVEIELMGDYRGDEKEPFVILSSFNAG